MNLEPWTMNNVPRNTKHERRVTSDMRRNCPSTSVESSLQINPFYAKQTQFPKKSNDVNPYNTTVYERKRNWTLSENKPNSNPIKPNWKRAKMNITSIITKDYRKKDDFVVRINKPNLVRRRRIANSVFIEDYENEPPSGPKKQTQTKPIS